MELAEGEADYLTELLEQYRELVVSAPHHDPAVARLSPDAYPDDAEASAEFRRLTSDEVSERRFADLDVVLDLLRSRPSTASPGTPVTLRLDPVGQSAWLRALAGLRLVLATRIGIDDENPEAPGDPRYDVYEWLGYRQEMLLRSLEA
ncbi:DUF2017 family protein [Microbacterium radiodurans]|uniref:DUF2017 family protein n=2 Tax=Microbacterium radiodurans TaxID=661398 RepID=A0A5J5ISB8_9MICO|nr:DUF2017 family protein [Microbacterium radiodurans]